MTLTWNPPSTYTRIQTGREKRLLAVTHAAFDLEIAIRANESNPCVETINAYLSAAKAKRAADAELEQYDMSMKYVKGGRMA